MGFIIRQLMAYPEIYSNITLMLRGKKKTQSFVDQYIRPKKGDKVLDIGCGTGDILYFLPDVDYYGFDLDSSYIEMAKKRFGKRGKFFCKMVSRDAVQGAEEFDLITAMGILHHLNDDEAHQLFELAYHLLKPGGRLITYDGCYVKDQFVATKFILWLDRGKFIRWEAEYKDLAKSIFKSVTTHIRHDLLNIPYTIIIIECKK
jgi:cyclopropane fatty-acyl-phospholipid synthase-like methyltransferase